MKGLMITAMYAMLFVACNETKKVSDESSDAVEVVEQNAETTKDEKLAEEETENLADAEKSCKEECAANGKTCDGKCHDKKAEGELKETADASTCKEECAKKGKSCDGKCKA